MKIMSKGFFIAFGDIYPWIILHSSYILAFSNITEGYILFIHLRSLSQFRDINVFCPLRNRGSNVDFDAYHFAFTCTMRIFYGTFLACLNIFRVHLIKSLLILVACRPFYLQPKFLSPSTL